MDREARARHDARGVGLVHARDMDREARARHDRPTPWADALIDTPRRDALQRRTVHRLELANQTMSH